MVHLRNGTVDLFAAMNVATGEVLTGLQKRHTAADVLRFFKQIDAAVPGGLAVHVVLDNSGKPPPKTSSPKSDAAARHSTRPNSATDH